MVNSRRSSQTLQLCYLHADIALLSVHVAPVQPPSDKKAAALRTQQLDIEAKLRAGGEPVVMKFPLEPLSSVFVSTVNQEENLRVQAGATTNQLKATQNQFAKMGMPEMSSFNVVYGGPTTHTSDTGHVAAAAIKELGHWLVPCQEHIVAGMVKKAYDSFGWMSSGADNPLDCAEGSDLRIGRLISTWSKKAVRKEVYEILGATLAQADAPAPDEEDAAQAASRAAPAAPRHISIESLQKMFSGGGTDAVLQWRLGSMSLLRENSGQRGTTQALDAPDEALIQHAAPLVVALLRVRDALGLPRRSDQEAMQAEFMQLSQIWAEVIILLEAVHNESGYFDQQHLVEELFKRIVAECRGAAAWLKQLLPESIVIAFAAIILNAPEAKEMLTEVLGNHCAMQILAMKADIGEELFLPALSEARRHDGFSGHHGMNWFAAQTTKLLRFVSDSIAIVGMLEDGGIEAVRADKTSRRFMLTRAIDITLMHEASIKKSNIPTGGDNINEDGKLGPRQLTEAQVRQQQSTPSDFLETHLRIVPQLFYDCLQYLTEHYMIRAQGPLMAQYLKSENPLQVYHCVCFILAVFEGDDLVPSVPESPGWSASYGLVDVAQAGLPPFQDLQGKGSDVVKSLLYLSYQYCRELQCWEGVAFGTIMLPGMIRFDTDCKNYKEQYDFGFLKCYAYELFSYKCAFEEWVGSRLREKPSLSQHRPILQGPMNSARLREIAEMFGPAANGVPELANIVAGPRSVVDLVLGGVCHINGGVEASFNDWKRGVRLAGSKANQQVMYFTHFMIANNTLSKHLVDINNLHPRLRLLSYSMVRTMLGDGRNRKVNGVLGYTGSMRGAGSSATGLRQQAADAELLGEGRGAGILYARQVDGKWQVQLNEEMHDRKAEGMAKCQYKVNPEDGESFDVDIDHRGRINTPPRDTPEECVADLHAIAEDPVLISGSYSMLHHNLR